MAPPPTPPPPKKTLAHHLHVSMFHLFGPFPKKNRKPQVPLGSDSFFAPPPLSLAVVLEVAFTLNPGSPWIPRPT